MPLKKLPANDVSDAPWVVIYVSPKGSRTTFSKASKILAEDKILDLTFAPHKSRIHRVGARTYLVDQSVNDPHQFL